MGAIGEQAALLQQEWQTHPRWAGITRHYSAQDVIRLRDCAAGEHSLARRGAGRLWGLLHGQDAVRAHGAVTGSRALQAARAGSQAVYLPGWQAADANLAGHTDPGQSLAPVSPAARVVRQVNDALLRADRLAWAQRSGDGTGPAERRLAPVVAQAGVGGALNAFELMKAMIEAGAAGVRFDDQLPARGKRGRSGQRVLIPTGQHIETLTAARLAADVLDVPTLVIARTGARAASLLTSDIDERDHEFLTGERTAEGFYRVEPGLYACGTRALAFAPYADMLWLETPAPDLAAARAFAAVIHSQYPDKLLAYSCSPSFNGRALPGDASTAKLRKELAAMGYRFQFIPLDGFHALDEPASGSADGYEQSDVPAYARP